MFNINKLIQKHASGHMFKHKSFRKSGRKWTEEGPGEIQWKAPTPEPPEEKSAIYWKGAEGLPEGSTLCTWEWLLTQNPNPTKRHNFLFCTAADLAQGVVGQKISYLLKRQCNKCKRPGYQGATKTKQKTLQTPTNKNFFVFFCWRLLG